MLCFIRNAVLYLECGALFGYFRFICTMTKIKIFTTCFSRKFMNSNQFTVSY